MKPIHTLEDIRQVVGGQWMKPRSPTTPHVLGISTDTRTLEPGDLFVALVGAHFDGHDYVSAALRRGAAGAVISDVSSVSESRQHLAIVVDDTLVAYGALARAHRLRRGTCVIAITGSAGKTTMKEMLATMLEGSAGVLKTPANENNLVGVPKLLLNLAAHHRLAIVELGTNAPGEIARLAAITEPDCAVLLNANESHLEGLRSFEGVVAEKAELLRALAPTATAFINGDDPGARLAGESCGADEVYHFGISESCEVRATDVRVTADGLRFRYDGTHDVSVPVLGRHNIWNALAALAAAEWAGVRRDDAVARLAAFRSPEMRLARKPLVYAGQTAELLVDCYNANPASMDAALHTLSELPCARRVAILGDMRDLGDRGPWHHQSVGQKLGRLGVSVLIAVGTPALAGALAERAEGTGVVVFRVDDAEDAAHLARQLVVPGDIVLIKGSRALHLERVVDEMVAAWPEIARQHRRATIGSDRYGLRAHARGA